MMRVQIFEADLIFAFYSLEAIYEAACIYMSGLEKVTSL